MSINPILNKNLLLNLSVKNIYINIDEKLSTNTNLIGASLRAEDRLNLNVGNNLILESVRDEYSSNQTGFNVNAGVGFGSGGKEGHRVPSIDIGDVSSVNSGISMNNGVSQSKQTVLSSIAGNEININVGMTPRW